MTPIDRLLGWPAWCEAPANDNGGREPTWRDAVRAWIVDPLARANPRDPLWRFPAGDVSWHLEDGAR